MLQREEREPPSDFQDYTLLALVAVACYLSDTDLGERNGLTVLGQRYNQDIEPLQQVGRPSSGIPELPGSPVLPAVAASALSLSSFLVSLLSSRLGGSAAGS